MAAQRRHVHFSGQVQGVGFRYAAARAAAGLAVTGYVRNLTDGGVEIVVEGQPDQIDSFLDALRGRMGMYVDEMTQQTALPTGEFAGFNIRFGE
jgi:acylphosphatase